MSAPLNESILQLLAEERASIERFHERLRLWQPRAGYLPHAQLSEAEPWQQALFDAVAFFAARTRLAAERNLSSMWERLLAEHAAPLLQPMPAMGLLRVTPPAVMSEPAALPRDTEVQLRRSDARAATLRTAWELPLAPLKVTPRPLQQEQSGLLRLDFEIEGALTPEAPLRLLLWVRNDTLRALQVLDALRRCVIEAALISGRDRDGQSFPCELRLCCDDSLAARADTLDHPVHQVRVALHQPERELFIELRPGAPPAGQRYPERLTLQLLLSGTALPVEVEGLLRRRAVELLPHVVPISNLQRMPVQLPLYDGTRDRLAVIHPLSDGAFAPYALLGLYEREGTVLTPLHRNVLPAQPGARGYDIEERVGPDGAPQLLIHPYLPDALKRPVTLVADVLWYQPWLQDRPPLAASSRPLRLSDLDERDLPPALEMTSRYVRGVRLALLGNLLPNRDNPLRAQPEALARLGELRSRERLDVADLQALLRALAVLPSSPYRGLPARLLSLTARRVPAATPSGLQSQQRYALALGALSPAEAPLLAPFLLQVRRLLDAYSPEPVQLEVTVNGAAWTPPPGWEERP